jgi:hypothetical protein
MTSLTPWGTYKLASRKPQSVDLQRAKLAEDLIVGHGSLHAQSVNEFAARLPGQAGDSVRRQKFFVREVRIDRFDLRDQSAVLNHRGVQIGCVGGRADPEKSIDGRQHRRYNRVAPETREYLLQGVELFWRTVRTAARLLLLSPADGNQERMIDAGPIDPIVER